MVGQEKLLPGPCLASRIESLLLSPAYISEWFTCLLFSTYSDFLMPVFFCVFSWLSALESTKWLQHLSLLLKASLLVLNAVDRDHRPVLVHCSDGWDRTPQIAALAKLLLDPYYRTIEVRSTILKNVWNYYEKNL